MATWSLCFVRIESWSGKESSLSLTSTSRSTFLILLFSSLAGTFLIWEGSHVHSNKWRMQGCTYTWRLITWRFLKPARSRIPDLPCQRELDAPRLSGPCWRPRSADRERPDFERGQFASQCSNRTPRLRLYWEASFLKQEKEKTFYLCKLGKLDIQETGKLYYNHVCKPSKRFTAYSTQESFLYLLENEINY